MDKIKQDFMSKTGEFWSYFVARETFEAVTRILKENIPQDFFGFEKFRTTVNKLFDLAQSYVQTISRLQTLFDDKKIDLLNNFNAQISAILHSQLPNDYNTIIYQFYRITLKVFTKDDTVGGMYV